MTRLANFFRLSFADRLLVSEAFLFLGAARFAVLTVSFRRLASFLGQRDKTINSIVAGRENDRSPEVEKVYRAIWLTSRHTPWLSNCLAKAVAARLMLRRRRINSTLYFGMAKTDAGEFEAHAWLSSAGKILKSGDDPDRYAVVAAFTD